MPKTQKNVNAKNINVQDMNSLITQPFKFHQGLKEEKARPNLFWVNIKFPKFAQKLPQKIGRWPF